MFSKSYLLALAAGMATTLTAAATTYPTPDVFDLNLGIPGIASDRSPMNMTVESHGDIKVYWNDVLQRFTSTLNNTWCAEGDNVQNYIKFNYLNRTDFQQALRGGHTIECTFRAIDVPGDFPVQAKPFASHEWGGTGLELADNGYLQFSVNVTQPGETQSMQSYHMANSGMRIMPDTYYQLIGTWDPVSNVSRVYINGRLMAQTDAAGTLTFPNATAAYVFYIGCDTNGFGQPSFAGNWEIVTARIWSHALSPDEVEAVWDDMALPQYVIKDVTVDNGVVHDSETNPSSVEALKVSVDWQRPTGFDPQYYEVKGYDLRFTYNDHKVNGQYTRQIYDTYIADDGRADGHFTYDFEPFNGLNKTAIDASEVKVTIVNTFKVLKFQHPENAGAAGDAAESIKLNAEVKGYPTTLKTTPGYDAAIGELTATAFKDRYEDLWRVDLDFDRALLTDYPEPVSYFQLQYKPANSASDWTDIPGLRVMMSGYNTAVASGQHIPGNYRFGNETDDALNTDKGYANHGDNDRVVACHTTTDNPTGNQYRAVAVYAPANALIKKTPMSYATVSAVGTTSIADIATEQPQTTPQAYYNLQGQRVAVPVHGAVYITADGHKILVK